MFSNSKITKITLGTGGLEALGQLSSFAGVLAYTQLVPRDVLGSYFLLVAVAGVLAFVGSTGVSTDLIRQISRSSTSDTDLMTGLTFAGLVTVGLSLATAVSLRLVGSYLGYGFGTTLLVLLPVFVFSNVFGAVLQGEKKNTRAVALATAQKLLTYVIGSVSVLAGVDPPIALTGGLLGGKLLELFGGIAFVDIVPAGRPRLSELRELAGRVLNLTVAGLGNLGQQWIDTLLIGALLTHEAVAVYEVAWRLSAVGLIVTNALASVLYPRFADAVAAGDRDIVRRYAQRAFFYVSAPMLGLFAGALALGPELVTLVYGGAYGAAFLPLLVLLAGRFPYSLSRITTMLSYSYDFDSGVTKASVSAALINAGANVALISLFGLVGAAVGSLLSYTVLTVFLFDLVSDQIDYPQPGQFVPAVLAAGVMLGCVRLLATMLPATLPALGLLVATGAVLFLGVLVALSPMVRADVRRFTGHSE